jgi:hypothetical protein
VGAAGEMWFTGKLRLIAGMAVLLLASCLPQRSALPSCPMPTPLSPVGIPTDVCGPEFNFTEFGAMAWQTFKTLAWPAHERGIPDEGRPITDMKGPRVFETYKSDWETFQALRAPPLPWHEYPSQVPDWLCANAATLPPLDKGTLVLASLHKFGNIDQRDETPGPPNEAITHLLVAQNGSLVRYLTGFDQKAFKGIRDNKLYEPVDIPISYQAPGSLTKAAYGAITIKSAWIEMIGDIDPSEFYVRSALVQQPAAKPAERSCKRVDVGLVGLHIAHKTEKSPQWIWASFEHVKNVPQRGHGKGSPRTFNDGSGKLMEEHPPPEARLPMEPFVKPPPYNVDRWKELPKQVSEVNDLWQKKLRKDRSVWANYELVAIQWAGLRGMPDHTGSGVQIGDLYSAQPEPPCLSGDASLANSVIETFLQPHTTCAKELTCMTCHNKVRSYDFIWSIPLAGKEPNPSPMRQKALSVLYDVLKSSDRQ